ncbi:MAG: ABC transporter permease [Melioribacteraceae bacterium]|jgi:putative ABC transport system permease protein|nr:ABC transporter permease [Melioribacteraceae bacterium]RJP62182.1 MAG: FtsX-like permease family protein [Ignavibacteriales bacterium]WKZ71212.1 MAG: ABC transporter permease [Melioribacteraceae bacterium]
MQIKESIVMAFDSLRTNKLRSILTLIGIGIGLFSIIIVMTAIGAVQKTVEDAFSSIGTNNFIIQKYPAVRMGPGHWRMYRNRKDLTSDQGRRLKELTILPTAIGIEMDDGGNIVKYKNLSTNPNVNVIGTDLDNFMVNDLKVEFGRGFTIQDMDYIRRYAIIGKDVADKLFENVDPIGEEIKVDNQPFEVIGVFEKKGSVLGSGQDNFVAIPLPMFERMYGEERGATFTIMAPSPELMERTMDEVIGALRVIRKVPIGEDNDFEIVTNDQLVDQFNDLTKYFKLGAGVVAFIALLAAGVGIMNIMLVSVTERTREIGIRKAIGARKSIIRSQFVAEAIVLSQIGGIGGIVLGVLGGNLVAIMINVSVVVPIDWIMIGLTVTTLVGVVFGVYPAIKASNLDPIEALRYE